MDASYTFTSKILVYSAGGSSWRFVGLPTARAKEIKEAYGKRARGWGSLPVTVTIGETRWETSIFPDTNSGTYLLPLKAKVRKAEHILDEDTVSCTLALR